MAQSKADKGFTINKFPAFSGTWNQNHVDWLVAKFGERVGEIKASDVRKKGSSKITNEKYRELLELVVKSKHYVTASRQFTINMQFVLMSTIPNNTRKKIYSIES